MPQVDLVSACAGDSKISCETLANDDDDPPPSDLPPDSFFLSKAAEIDWIDRNAFIERKDSAKAGSNLILNLPIASNHSFDSGSHKLPHPQCAKSKPSIIGLPKTQKATYAEATHRRRSGSIRLFPKRSHSSNSGRKSAVPLTEPSSPKVSCMGRVKSKRDRSRRKKQLEPPRITKKTGFWSGFRSIFRFECHKHIKEHEPARPAGSLTKSRSVRKPDFSAADPPVLGAVNRFSSGRRSDAWAADVEADDVRSQPLDRGLGPTSGSTRLG